MPVWSLVVESGYHGSAGIGDTIKVRGAGDAASAEFPTLTPGRRYLLFLSAVEWEPGTPTGQFVVTGQQGAFNADGQRATRLTTAGDLPLAGTLADLTGTA